MTIPVRRVDRWETFVRPLRQARDYMQFLDPRYSDELFIRSHAPDVVLVTPEPSGRQSLTAAALLDMDRTPARFRLRSAHRERYDRPTMTSLEACTGRTPLNVCLHLHLSDLQIALDSH